MSQGLKKISLNARSWLRAATSLTRTPGTAVKAAPLALVVLMGVGTEAEAKRLALIVGNAQYDNVYSLKNAAKDAKDIADRLQGLDFEVTLLTDVDGADFNAQLEAFAKKAEAEDVESTLFYFSGHAFQLDGTNYLVPSDAALNSREAIENQTWRLDEIVGRLEDKNRQTLIFLDACRNNPLPESQRGTNQGLAKLETGSGTYVAFATQPGNVTSDGAGENSPFTTALLEHIETPGISIADMMIRVRNDVQTATFRKQTPWDQSSLFEQFYFEPVVERSAELTEADYELIAALDPETRNRLLAALGSSGVNIEIEEIEDEEPEKVEVVSLDTSKLETGTATLLIDDVEDDPAGTDTAAQPTDPVEPKPVEPKVEVVVAQSVKDKDERIAALNAELGHTTVAPTETQTATAVDSTEATAVTGTAVATATTDTGEATTEGQQVAGLVPEDPQPKRTNVIADESALVLAALSPSRTIEPAALSLPRTRVVGTEIDRNSEEAAALGIEPEAPQLEGKELAKAAQRELRRLGCYRMAIDGDWGRGSNLALVRYYANKGIAPESLDPTNALLTILRSEGKVVCTQAVETKKKVSKSYKAAKAKKAAPKKAVKKTKAKKKTSSKKVIKRTVTKKSAGGSTKKKTIKRIQSGVFR